YLHARPRARPDVAVDVAANPVGGRRGACAGNIELDEALAVAQRLAVDVVHADVAAHAGVGDVHLLIVGREADAVGPALIVRHFFELSRLRVDAIHRFLRFLLALEPFVVAAYAVRRIGEPDAA